MNKIEYVNFKKFEDKFGNLIHIFEVVKYEKISSGEWKETERKESGRSTYIVDGQLYFRLDDSLIELNMDFDSKSCGSCYQIGKTIENKRKITGNDILFTCLSSQFGSLSLHKQSYSNNTCFYTLQDERGNWKVNYGSNDINKLIEQIQEEISVIKELKPLVEFKYRILKNLLLFV